MAEVGNRSGGVPQDRLYRLQGFVPGLLSIQEEQVVDEQWFVLDVNPEPWEIGPLNVVRKGGQFRPFVGRSQQLHDYKLAVAEGIRRGSQPYHMIDGDVSLTCWFWRHRPDYETWQARRHRKHEADDTNLFKATEDALQGILYDNDKNNVHIQGFVVAQGPDVEPGVIICAKPAPGVADMMRLIPPDVLCRLAKPTSTPTEDPQYSGSDPGAFF